MSAMPADQTNRAVEKVISRTAEIAVMPQVVYKIMEMTSSTDASSALLEKAIVIDPGFSAKILTQANSAFYALPRKVTSIREAVAFLGFRAVRQMAMAAGVFDLFVGKTDKESLRRRSWWRHSLDTAVCCRFIATKLGLGVADEAYTAGLLHYIGKTLLDRSDPAQYEKVMLLLDRGLSDVNSERAVFGCDHVQVGIAAAAHWGFPEVLISSMDYVNEPDIESEHARLIALIHLGDKIAQAVLAGKEHVEDEENLVEDWSLTMLGITSETLRVLTEESSEAIAAAGVLSF